MDNIEEIKNKILQHIEYTILNSNVSDWVYEGLADMLLRKDNIYYKVCDNYFYISIKHKNNNNFYSSYYLYFNYRIFLNKKEKKRRKILRQKAKDIIYYLENKKNIDRLNNEYNSLPISEIRKEKLYKLN